MLKIRSIATFFSDQVCQSLVLICAVAAFSSANFAIAESTATKENSSKPENETSQPKATEKVLRHAVFFKFKDTATDKDVDGVVDAFRALPSKLDVIKDFKAGKNNSRVGMDDGFTHCFLLTFQDEAGRAVYLPHDDHKAFGAILRPHLDKVFVIDYWGTPHEQPKGDEITNMAFIKFKDTASAADIRRFEEAFLALPFKIDAIKSIEWGKNNSPEKHDDGFTHALTVTFDSEADLDKYASHPEHQAFIQNIASSVEKVRILHFLSKKGEATGTR